MADGIQNFGSLVGQTAQDATSQSQTQNMSQDVGSSYFIFANYGLKILNTQLLVEYQSIGTAFILGHPLNGILGTSTLGAGTYGSYSTVYSGIATQSLTSAAIASIVSWFTGTSINPPTYLALGIGQTYFENFSTSTYKDAANTTATGW
jgi:hypothetical protein